MLVVRSGNLVEVKIEADKKIDPPRIYQLVTPSKEHRAIIRGEIGRRLRMQARLSGVDKVEFCSDSRLDELILEGTLVVLGVHHHKEVKLILKNSNRIKNRLESARQKAWGMGKADSYKQKKLSKKDQVIAQDRVDIHNVLMDSYRPYRHAVEDRVLVQTVNAKVTISVLLRGWSGITHKGASLEFVSDRDGISADLFDKIPEVDQALLYIRAIQLLKVNQDQAKN